jgi:predicted transport protein
VLAAYGPKAPPAVYRLGDHPHLLASPVRELFEAFRKEVLALDKCVTEEFLKFYVAYKAETFFVDVYPQAKRLRLTLNLKFADVVDSQGRCKDMSGYRLNGEVEVSLTSLDELPYVMGLIRQSFERQMGDGDDPK